jgi:hypothetical protein
VVGYVECRDLSPIIEPYHCSFPRIPKSIPPDVRVEFGNTDTNETVPTISVSE